MRGTEMVDNRVAKDATPLAVTGRPQEALEGCLARLFLARLPGWCVGAPLIVRARRPLFVNRLSVPIFEACPSRSCRSLSAEPLEAPRG